MKQDEEDLQGTMDRILARRRERLGVGAEEDWQPLEEPPLFLQAARERARLAGCDLDELRRRDLQKMRDAPYPGPDCLQPDEVMAWAETRELPEERRAHVDSCSECCQLLAMATQPPLLPHEQPVPEVAPRRHIPPVWSPALAAACLLLTIGLYQWLEPLMGTAFHHTVASAKVVVLSPQDIAVSQSEDGAGVICSQVVTSMLSGLTAERSIEVVPWNRSAELSFALDRDLRNEDPTYLQRLKSGFGSGSLVRCSGQAGSEGVRLKLEIAGRGREPEVRSFEVPGAGQAQQISDLAFDAGRWVVEKLGLSETPSDAEEPFRSTMPSNAEALRLYSLGLAKLAENRPDFATLALKEAVQHEQHPLAYAALSEAWSQLGDENKERKFALAAFQAAGRYPLPEFEEKVVRGRYSEAFAHWENAIQLYSDLEKISPNPIDSAIRLAEAHLATSDAKSALTKINKLREAGVSELDTARLDVLEAKAMEILSEPEGQRRAALRAIGIGRKLGARHLEAEARLLAGRAARDLEDRDDAEKHILRAGEIFREIGDANGAAAVLQEQGTSAWQIEHDGERAEILLEDALRRYARLGNRGEMARVQIKLGHVDDDLHNRPEDARAHYKRALQKFSELGNERGIAQARLSLGVLDWRSFRDFTGAERELEAALRGFKKISDRSGEARVFANHGQLLFERGEIPDARETLEKSLDLREEAGLRRDEAFSHRILAEVLVYEDDLPAAEKHHDEALAIYQEIYQGELDKSPEAARVRLRRAVVWMEQGKLSEAEAEIQKIRDLSRTLPMAPSEQDVRLALAQLRLLQGKPGEARALLQPVAGVEARREYERAILSARIDIATGQSAAAAARLLPLVEKTVQEGLVLIELEARLALAEAHLADQAESAQAELETIQRRAEELGIHLLARSAEALLHRDG